MVLFSWYLLFAHLSVRVELPLFRCKLLFESFDLAGCIGENILHFFLVVGVDFVKLELVI